MVNHPRDIQLRTILPGHRAAVNVVDFDERYIVSASGDRTIKVCQFISFCGIKKISLVCILVMLSLLEVTENLCRI